MRSIAPLKPAPKQIIAPVPGQNTNTHTLRPLSIDQWLAAKQVAAHFGLGDDSAYRWIDDGTVPDQYVKRCGRMRIRIHPDILPLLEKTFEEAHA